MAALERLEAVRSAALPADLSAWAETFAQPAVGPAADPTASEAPGTELLGHDGRADTYTALLWNGARLQRSATAGDAHQLLVDGLVLLATTCGAAPGSQRLDSAVSAGLREAQRAGKVIDAVPSPQPVAGVTTWVTAAAVCAAVAGGGTTAGNNAAHQALVDLAGALLVVHAPPRERTDPACDPGMLLGHTLAAGWLAVRLHAAGVVGSPDTYERTIDAVVGAP